jgi:hypothetical protein
LADLAIAVAGRVFGIVGQCDIALLRRREFARAF